MRNTGILFFIILTLADLLGVSMGYAGIARLKFHHLPPFPTSDTADLFRSGAPWSPDRITLIWDSARFLIWLCCLLVPVITGVLILKRQYVAGWTLLFAWTAVSGLYGFWLWFFSLFCC